MSWAGISGIKASQPPPTLKLWKKDQNFFKMWKDIENTSECIKIIINSSDSRYLFLSNLLFQLHCHDHNLVSSQFDFIQNYLELQSCWNGFSGCQQQYSRVTVVQIFPIPLLLMYIVQSKYYSKKTRIPTMCVDCLQGQTLVALELPRRTWTDA